MRYIITALSLLFIVSIQAQKPEKLKTKTAKGPNGISEISCQVLKSDRKIKHGFYKEKKIFSTQLIESGFYSYGEKDGFWQEWYIISSSLKSKGVYSNGKKVGVWEYMNFRGELLHKYNHDTETVLFNNSCGKNKESQVLINEVQISKNLDCLPDVLGGISSLYDATILSSFLEEKSIRFNEEDTAIQLSDYHINEEKSLQFYKKL